MRFDRLPAAMSLSALFIAVALFGRVDMTAFDWAFFAVVQLNAIAALRWHFKRRRVMP